MLSYTNPYFLLALILVICSVEQAKAQSSDLSLLQKITSERSSAANTNSVSESYKPSFLPLRIVYGFYRKVISEQISANCAFDLSCSRFSAKAFGEFGFVKASLLTADRLTRCNPQIAHELPPSLFNTKTGKIIDEPALY